MNEKFLINLLLIILFSSITTLFTFQNKKNRNTDIAHEFIQSKSKDIESTADFFLLKEYNRCLQRKLIEYYNDNPILSKDITLDKYLQNDNELFEVCMIHQAQWHRDNNRDKDHFIKMVFKEKNMEVPIDEISKDIIEILNSK